MLTIRTDLAIEAHALWQETAGKTSLLPGVKAQQGHAMGFPLERVEILDSRGEQALGKPKGTYLSVDISGFWRWESDSLQRVAAAISSLLRPMVPEEGAVLVAGLGNRQMTPDALGPLACEHLLVTRHLGKVLPILRPVAALAAGVLGSTGIEVAEWVRGASARVNPKAVILIDALAARDLGRLCNTVQLSDTGLIPGSGVGNHRMALNRDSLGVPVLSLGVPTVVDVATVARDILAESGWEERDPLCLKGKGTNFFVTPDSVDSKMAQLGKVLGYGVSLALQPELEYEDLLGLLE